MTAYCATYGKSFTNQENCPHCAYEREMQTAAQSEFHWVAGSTSICEFRGKWYWTDETENFGNYEGCATQAEAEREQEEYARHL